MPEKKSITYTDPKNGEKYNISYSEELQLKNYHATREQTRWLKMNFYVKILLLLVMFGFSIVFVYLIYRLDYINFFTRILTGK
ncbi:hypothetical protein J4476_02015 [Candidatus Woesearchaeota archaeon]|nr:hypothetical protein [Candidatus Woesearchaeota archaeon]HIH26152.1 hypothetical protein [Nanoarchaeota archaeon]